MKQVNDGYIINHALNMMCATSLGPKRADGSARYDYDFVFRPSLFVSRVEGAMNDKARKPIETMNDSTLGEIVGLSLAYDARTAFRCTSIWKLMRDGYVCEIPNAMRMSGGHKCLIDYAMLVLMAATYDIAATCAVINIEYREAVVPVPYRPCTALKRLLVRRGLVPSQLTKVAV